MSKKDKLSLKSHLQSIETFTDIKFGDIHGLVIDYEPWMSAQEIFDVIGLGRYYQINRIHHFPEDEKMTIDYDMIKKYIRESNNQEDIKNFNCLLKMIDHSIENDMITLINKPGVYRAIFRSKAQKPKEFQDWVFKQLLPNLESRGVNYHKLDILNDTLARYEIVYKHLGDDNRSLQILKYIDSPDKFRAKMEIDIEKQSVEEFKNSLTENISNVVNLIRDFVKEFRLNINI